MKRTQMVIAGAERLFATENAVDSALTETGDLIATLTRLRLTSNISGVYGQDAIGAVMDGAAALTAARGHFIRAHGLLDQIKTQLGCRTVMSGTLQPKPDSDGVTPEVADVA
jgi:hypothetical protein